MKLPDKQMEDDIKPERSPSTRVICKLGIPILIAIGSERCCYFAVTGQLVEYFIRELGISQGDASAIMGILQFLAYYSSVVPGFIADAWSGRFTVLMFCLVMTLVGVFTVIMCNLLIAEGDAAEWVIYLAVLGIYAPMSAAIRPLLMVIGADQFGVGRPESRRTFLQSVYWTTNLAALVSYALREMISHVPSTSSNQYNVTFLLGMVCLSISVFLVILISNRIHTMDPVPRSLLSFLKSLATVCILSRTTKGILFLAGAIMLFAGNLLSVASLIGVSLPLTWFYIGFLALGGAFLIYSTGDVSWVYKAADHPNKRYESHRHVLHAIAQIYQLGGVMAVTMPFWGVAVQVHSSLVMIGCQTEAPETVNMSSILATVNASSIVLYMPMHRYLVRPTLRKYFPDHFPVPRTFKLAIGFAFSFCASMFTGILESIRKGRDFVQVECTEQQASIGYCTVDQIGTTVPQLSRCYDSVDGDAPILVHDLNFYWLFAPACLIAFGEVAVGTVTYDIFYTLVPDALRATMQSVQFTSVGGGVALITGLAMVIMSPHRDTNDSDNNSWDYIFWAIAAIQFSYSAAFMWKFRKHKNVEATAPPSHIGDRMWDKDLLGNSGHLDHPVDFARIMDIKASDFAIPESKLAQDEYLLRKVGGKDSTQSFAICFRSSTSIRDSKGPYSSSETYLSESGQSDSTLSVASKKTKMRAI